MYSINTAYSISEQYFKFPHSNMQPNGISAIHPESLIFCIWLKVIPLCVYTGQQAFSFTDGWESVASASQIRDSLEFYLEQEQGIITNFQRGPAKSLF